MWSGEHKPWHKPRRAPRLQVETRLLFRLPVLQNEPNSIDSDRWLWYNGNDTSYNNVGDWKFFFFRVSENWLKDNRIILFHSLTCSACPAGSQRRYYPIRQLSCCQHHSWQCNANQQPLPRASHKEIWTARRAFQSGWESQSWAPQDFRGTLWQAPSRYETCLVLFFSRLATNTLLILLTAERERERERVREWERPGVVWLDERE